MPGRHWSLGRQQYDKEMAALDANRRAVDAHVGAVERRIFETTTRQWLDEPVDPARPGTHPARDDSRVPDLADLDPNDLDDEGKF